MIIVGLEEIARYLGLSHASLKRHSRTLQEIGVLFPMWRGRPPRRMICTFTDRLQAWLVAAGDGYVSDEDDTSR